MFTHSLTLPTIEATFLALPFWICTPLFCHVLLAIHLTAIETTKTIIHTTITHRMFALPSPIVSPSSTMDVTKTCHHGTPSARETMLPLIVDVCHRHRRLVILNSTIRLIKFNIYKRLFNIINIQDKIILFNISFVYIKISRINYLLDR